MSSSVSSNTSASAYYAYSVVCCAVSSFTLPQRQYFIGGKYLACFLSVPKRLPFFSLFFAAKPPALPG